MTMNMDPANVALLLRNLAVAAGMDTTALDALLTMGGFSIEGQQQINGDSSTFAGFNVVEYTKQAMQALSVDLQTTTTVTIGEYTVGLTFSQAAVKVTTDDTITSLIPIVGQPIVQSIVDASVLSFDTIVMSDVAEGSFKVQMKGSITNTGPMDATIKFPQALSVYWQGQQLGTVTMADINAIADQGAVFDVQGSFTVTNGDAMGTFAAYLINNDDFQWEITGSSISVSALGYTFTGVSLQKYVTLAGANGFKDAVTVNSFDLPANDPAGGVTLNVDVSINNPSQVGFSLGGAAFENYFGSVDIGPLASKGAANFAPRTTSRMQMTGRLLPQTTQEGIVAITTIFGHYLAGQSSTLTIYGVSGSGSSGQVSWLTKAFKTIKIENVVLPGPATIPTLIPSIDMKDLTLDFTQDQWAPPTSSNNTQAKLQSPFGFPINVVQLDMKVQASFNGGNIASLDIPTSPASTSSDGIITTGFSGIPFNVQNHDLFSQFNHDLTLGSSVTFGLQGTSNAVAETAVGTLSLPGITFDVDTSLAGFNNFGGSLTINSLSVSGAEAGYITVTLSITLTNPSSITISVGDINFDVSTDGAVIGKAYLFDATILPGAQTYSSEMHLGEGVTDAAGVLALGKILTAYLTGSAVPLLVAGSTTSTTIVPIQAGLAEVKLNTIMNGITDGLIKSIAVTADLMQVIGGEATANIVLYNPLDVPFTIRKIHAECYHYILCSLPEYASIYHTDFLTGTVDIDTDLTIPAKSSVTTDAWPVKLGGGPDLIMNLLPIADYWRFFNVTQNASVIVGNNFQVDNMYYAQKMVGYTVDIPGITDTPQDILQGTYCPNLAGVNITATALNATLTNSTDTNTTTIATTTVSSTLTTISTDTMTITTTDLVTTTSTEVATTTENAETTTDAETTTEAAATTTEAETTTTTSAAEEEITTD